MTTGTNRLMGDVLFVTHILPNTLSSGGEHRTYQIHRELIDLAGDDHVHLFDPRLVATDPKRVERLNNPPPIRIPWRVRQFFRRVRAIADNPYRLFLETGFTMRKFGHRGLVARYQAALARFRPTLCVVQHAACAWMVPLNRERGIRTLVCPQNLDSIDHSLELRRKTYLAASLGDLANEIAGLATFDGRLFISKVETAFVTGLGVPAHYYPYFPVGAIKDYFAAIRRKRQQSPPEPGLFVMLGSASHEPIRSGMAWFIEGAEQHGLPPGAKVVIVGTSTQKLLPAGKRVAGIETLGWLDETELARLLAAAQGVLLPKFRGFGSATRLMELFCAGIPVIASQYVTFAVDSPPNVIEATDDWQTWRDAMGRRMRDSAPVVAGYEAWEAQQPSALKRVIGKQRP